MIEVCVYCGEPRNDKMGCCGENHWEEVEDYEDEDDQEETKDGCVQAD